MTYKGDARNLIYRVLIISRLEALMIEYYFCF